MEPVVGIFQSCSDAERAIQQLYTLGVPNNRVGLLTPGTNPKKVESGVPVTDAEPPGIGKALGAAVGGAIGTAGGATMGAALASLLVPGVGPVIAGGLIGAAILGTGGAATGLVAGEALEEGLDDGLPHDELFVYEDALRKGRSVVIAFAEDSNQADRVHHVLDQNGAETVDAANVSWWLGLRPAEQAYYEAKGGDFKRDEVSYRQGFQAALHPECRGKLFGETRNELAQTHGEVASSEAFQHGYERGQA